MELEKRQKDAHLMAAVNAIASIQDAYSYEAQKFAEHIKAEEEISPRSIQSYIDNLKELRSKHDGSIISAETYNKHVKAIKNRIRYLIQNQQLSVVERFQIEDFLKGIKLKRIHSSAVTEENIPTKEEMYLLLREAPVKLSLIMEFLLYTGARISEALRVENSDVKVQKESVIVRLRGKGDKERFVYLVREVYNQIRVEFNGQKYLFEHNGRPYNRVATTNRIREVSMKLIGKSISAHDVRHRLGTDMTAVQGLWAAKEYLGHSSIATTDRFYNHNKVTARDIKDLYKR